MIASLKTATTEDEARSNFLITLLRPPIVTPAGSLNMSSLTPPIAIAYLSSSLKEAGFSVNNIDALGTGLDHVDLCSPESKVAYQGLSIKEILERIDPRTRILGLSCMFSNEWPFTKKLIRHVKATFPDLLIVAGGEHITALPDFILSDCKEINIVALGEGEETIVELAKCIYEGRALEKVNGLKFRRNGEIVTTPPRARLRNIDAIPWPDWDNVGITNYFREGISHGPYRGRTMPLLATRGCPYKCTFCSNPQMYGTLYMKRSPADVINEIKLYMQKYNAKCFEFYDLTAITSKKWIHEFCDIIIKEGLEFKYQLPGGTRSEALDEAVLVKLKKTGCEYITYAPESGSEEVLKEVKKQVNLERMVASIRTAVEVGIATRANLIIGFPKDTRWQVYQSLLFQMKLAFWGVVDCPIFEFSPYPGTELFDYLREKGVINELSDEWFESLGQSLLEMEKKPRYCERIGYYELLFYRFLGMSVFYTIYYITKPRRLFRFIKNIFKDHLSDSVFEQRIITHLRKLRVTRQS